MITRRQRQAILRNIVRERQRWEDPEELRDTDVDQDLVVIRTDEWEAGRYSLTPTHVGEIEVEYSTRGYRAIYGFDRLGNVFCYMD